MATKINPTLLVIPLILLTFPKDKIMRKDEPESTQVFPGCLVEITTKLRHSFSHGINLGQPKENINSSL